MGVVDTLVTRFAADTRDYEAGARRVTGSTRDVDMATKGAGLSMMNLVDAARMAAQAYALVNGAIIAVGVASYRKFAEFDALQKSLEAVEGNAKNAAAAMKMLRDVAKLPGLGLVEAAEGYRGLRLQGLDPGQSERVIRAAGNANAAMGGGRAELESVLRAIRQILSRPNLSGEELNQLAEAGLPAHRILLDAFGTSDGAELKKLGIDSREALEALVQGMEKMKGPGESAKNALENLQQAAELAVISIGSGVAGALTNGIGDVTKAIEDLESSGGFKLVGEGIADVINSLNPFRDESDDLSASLKALAGHAYAATQVVASLNEQLKRLYELPGMAGPGGKWIYDNIIKPYVDDFNAVQEAGKGIESESGKSGMGGLIPSLINDAIEGAMSGINDITDMAGASASSAERGAANPQLHHLRNIDRNTREAVEIQRMILGGGNRGRFGVTATDLSEIRSSPHGSPANPGFARWAGFGVPGLARR